MLLSVNDLESNLFQDASLTWVDLCLRVLAWSWTLNKSCSLVSVEQILFKDPDLVQPLALPNSGPKSEPSAVLELEILAKSEGLNFQFSVSCSHVWEFISCKLVRFWPKPFKKSCSTHVTLQQGAIGSSNHQPVRELEGQENGVSVVFLGSFESDWLNRASTHRGRPGLRSRAPRGSLAPSPPVRENESRALAPHLSMSHCLSLLLALCHAVCWSRAPRRRVLLPLQAPAPLASTTSSSTSSFSICAASFPAPSFAVAGMAAAAGPPVHVAGTPRTVSGRAKIKHRCGFLSPGRGASSPPLSASTIAAGIAVPEPSPAPFMPRERRRGDKEIETLSWFQMLNS
jgi:hypothetical protein